MKHAESKGFHGREQAHVSLSWLGTQAHMSNSGLTDWPVAAVEIEREGSVDEQNESRVNGLSTQADFHEI